MQNTKIFSLLEHFSATEISRFSKYIASPYFNEQNELIVLYECLLNLIKNHPSTNDSDQIKRFIWKKTHQSKPFKDVVFRRMCSELYKLAVCFLAHQQFENQPFLAEWQKIHVLNSPVLHKHFIGAIRSFRLEQEKTGLRNSSFHYHQLAAEYECHVHLEKQRAKRHDLINLEKADFALDCFYTTIKLKHYCEKLDYSNIHSLDAQVELPFRFLEELSHSRTLEEPSVKVYYLIASVLLYPDDETHFQTFKNFLDTQADYFSFKELKSFYTAAMNYCISTKINNGRVDYYEELFELYKQSLERELLFEDGLLSPSHYKNIITIGLLVKSFDWVEEFIQDYTERLPKENQDNAINYNIAKVHFSKKNYPMVIEKLREVVYKNLEYALGGKLMLLKTYYELGELNALDSLIDSFRIYLRRNKLISTEVRQQYLNILRFTKKLSGLPIYDKSALQKVKKQIDTCKALADKNWILQKVAEMEGS